MYVCISHGNIARSSVEGYSVEWFIQCGSKSELFLEWYNHVRYSESFVGRCYVKYQTLEILGAFVVMWSPLLQSQSDSDIPTMLNIGCCNVIFATLFIHCIVVATNQKKSDV